MNQEVQKTAAFKDGYQSYLNGESLIMNPCERVSDYEDWDAGWVAARHETEISYEQ